MELSRFVAREDAEQVALGRVQDFGAARVRFESRLGQHCKPRSSILRIRCAADKAIGLEPIDELRDVRFDTRESLGELSERQ